jgi:hypothetical protein
MSQTKVRKRVSEGRLSTRRAGVGPTQKAGPNGRLKVSTPFEFARNRQGVQTLDGIDGFNSARRQSASDRG